MPCSKKRLADDQTIKLVVIPKEFQQAILVDLHEKYGHPAGQKLFDTAGLMLHFKNLYQACFAIGTTCILCQQVRIDRSRSIPELNPLPIFPAGKVWLIGFKQLPRRTREGHSCILAVCDSFSNYCYLEPLQDQTALSTAKALIRRVLPCEPQLFWTHF
jgi:Integrase zinc binding domain